MTKTEAQSLQHFIRNKLQLISIAVSRVGVNEKCQQCKEVVFGAMDGITTFLDGLEAGTFEEKRGCDD